MASWPRAQAGIQAYEDAPKARATLVKQGQDYDRRIKSGKMTSPDLTHDNLAKDPAGRFPGCVTEAARRGCKDCPARILTNCGRRSGQGIVEGRRNAIT